MLRAIAVLLCIAFSKTARCEVELPPLPVNEPIHLAADRAARWQEGAWEVWHLSGNCHIGQGPAALAAPEAIVWLRQEGSFGDRQNRAIVYLDGGVTIDVAAYDPATPTGGGAPRSARMTDAAWFGRMFSISPFQIHVAPAAGEPATKPEIYARAIQRRDAGSSGVIRRTQFAPGDENRPTVDAIPEGHRRLRAFPRGDVPFQLRSYNNASRNEWIVVVDGGVNLIIDGLDEMGNVDILADRIVIWATGLNEPDLTGQATERDDTPLEIYMEGNLEFRQGDRIVYSDRMYYNVPLEVGTILNAEILSSLQGFRGLVRLKADLIRQTGRGRFFAENSFVTSSRLGLPGYRLQVPEAYFEDIQRPLVDPVTGAPLVDAVTGETLVDHERRGTSYGNTLYLGQVPVFYWPVFATNFEDPSFYISRFSVKNDNIFGTQVLTEWDVFQLLGFDSAPAGTDWDLSFDYLSERGFGYGSTFAYTRSDMLGIPGPYSGLFDAWFIREQGLDDLGMMRRQLIPEELTRGRVFGRHRHHLPQGFQFTGEVGWISDRNFLEQYYENEWDEFKDQTTGVELKQLVDNQSWSITADYRVNDFFTQTEWLPRADHFWLGQPLFGGLLSWFEHSSAGYGGVRVYSMPPLNPADVQIPLPWEVSTRGERLATRHEIDMPIDLGPVNIVPYALGEAAHWGEDINNEPLDRLYGQVGVRTSLPMWSANPFYENEILNLHGMAHKVVFDGQFAYSDANRDIAELPLYDPLNDDAIEHFQRRFTLTTFGGAIPPQFDDRFFALRSGIGSHVTSPTTEIADDLMVFRTGVRQRWQTKRGPPDQRRIIDWMTLDTGASLFPDADRDNFGDTVGLLNYDFRWHVGDRTTILSDGFFDMFEGGGRIATVGMFLNRPPRGSFYVGFRSFDGPINSKVIVTSLSYRMSPKWISTAGTSVDVGGNGNIGNRFTITRIGESLLVSVGFSVDESKDNTGVNFAIQPRFLPAVQLGQFLGPVVEPAGLYGLE